MGVFEQFPYTNFHDLNLDWILRVLKDFDKKLDNFVSNATIKYADPFQWTIVNQYPVNTVVIDPVDGTAYISTKAVPSGIALTNAEYWQPVYKYQELAEVLKKQIAGIDFRNVNVAPQNITKYDLCWFQNKLYRAQKNFTAGETVVFTDTTYMLPVTVEEAIKQIQTTGDLRRTAENIVDNVTGDYTEVAGDKSETFTNKTISVSNDLLIHAGNPIEFSKPAAGTNKNFDVLKMRTETGEPYNILVQNDNTVNIISKPVVISIGDSLTNGYASGSSREDYSWYNLGDHNLYEIHPYQNNGGGFIYKGEKNKTYLELLNDAHSDYPDCNILIVETACNDWAQEINALNSALKEFFTTARQYYPNAKIIFAYTTHSKVITIPKRKELEKVFSNTSSYGGIESYSLTSRIMLSCNGIDETHLTDDGYIIFASYMYSLLEGSLQSACYHWKYNDNSIDYVNDTGTYSFTNYLKNSIFNFNENGIFTVKDLFTKPTFLNYTVQETYTHDTNIYNALARPFYGVLFPSSGDNITITNGILLTSWVNGDLINQIRGLNEQLTLAQIANGSVNLNTTTGSVTFPTIYGMYPEYS